MSTRATIAAAVVAACTVGSAETASAARGDARAAGRLLGGTMWTTYSSGYSTGATQDRVAHLCSDGRFTVVTTFVSTYAEGADPSSYDHSYGESRVTGRWRVARARLSRDRRRGRISVRYVTDEGARGTVTFAAGRRGTTVDGAPAEVARSTMCR